MRKRVYSGIRATGRLHLGNYFGAVKGMLALQDKYDCIFSVVDMHTITVPYDVKTLKQSVREIILDYLAAGLDPKKCNLEIQSQVPQHTELAYLLSTIYPVSRLEDLPTYKEKKAQYPKYINMGLLYYPVLMAADVLLYKAELVPVGIDQEPHLEVMREIARKFNSMFSSTFPEPQRFETTEEYKYIPSLFGEGKMSKSVEGSYINLTDNLDIIKARVAKIPTDSGHGTIKQKKGPLTEEKIKKFINENNEEARGTAVLMELVELFEGKPRRSELEKIYTTGYVKYGEVKQELAQAIYKELQPFQERRKEFLENSKLVDSIIKESQQKCLHMAEETMQEVRSKMGLA